MTTMLPTEKDGQIIKQDKRGRVVTPKARREALLAEYDRSGMSGIAFARLMGIKPTTFADWLGRRRRVAQKTPQSDTTVSNREGAGGAVALQWVEAVVENPSKKVELANVQKTSERASRGSVLVVESRSGIRLEVSEEGHILWAAKLLRHLGESC